MRLGSIRETTVHETVCSLARRVRDRASACVDPSTQLCVRLRDLHSSFHANIQRYAGSCSGRNAQRHVKVPQSYVWHPGRRKSSQNNRDPPHCAEQERRPCLAVQAAFTRTHSSAATLAQKRRHFDVPSEFRFERSRRCLQYIMRRGYEDPAPSGVEQLEAGPSCW